MSKHLNIKVFGKVQGVLFRASAKREAENLGITGIIQNESDGSVYIEAEGPKKALDNFVAWCNKGPVMADVVRIETAEDKLKNFTDFKVI